MWYPDWKRTVVIINSANLNNSPVDIGARHILLLDDELSVRKALTRLLKACGHECTSASTGEEALEIIDAANQSNTRFDIAILDIKIVGGMGGIETMHEMKELGSAIPVISMSGYAIEEIFANAKARDGFSGHLQKPFNKSELQAELERLCP